MKTDINSLVSLITDFKNMYGDTELVRDLDTDTALTGTELYTQIIQCAVALKHIGLNRGDRVVIMSNSSSFWIVSDLAIALCGAVSVPLFVDISSENLRHEVIDSKARFALTATDILAGYFNFIDCKIEKIIVNKKIYDDPTLIYFNDFLLLGRTKLLKGFYSISDMFKELQMDDLYTIAYTSGSTSKPKGVEITHANMFNQIEAASIHFKLKSNKDKALSFLPMAHIFERMVILFYLKHGIQINFVDDISKITHYLKQIEPTAISMVPRVLEKIYSKIRTNVEHSYFIKKFIATVALDDALETNAHTFSKKKHTLFDMLVYKKIRKKFGSNIRYIIVGGAPLDYKLHNFFLNIGLPLYQGYGMTECSPVISVNYPGQNRVGTSGRALDGVDVKIADDGEILVKSISMMRGYHNLKEETENAFDREGWFYTGDIGDIDEDGFINVKSRKKELLKTSTGEYIRSVYVEQELNRHQDIEQSLVIAEGKKFVSALLFIDSTANRKNIQKYIEEINLKLNGHEQIKKYQIINELPTIEKGLLTPSHKLRRIEVMEQFKDKIDAMYG